MTNKDHNKQDHKERANQRGSVLWFILVGIVLLGALTIILSRSGSSVDQSGDVEKLNVQASQIMRYARSLEAGVEQMLLQGISENELSFANDNSTTDYTNNNCDDSSDRNYPYCLIFDSQGAGLNYMVPNERWLDSSNNAETYYGDWLVTGRTCLANVGILSSPGLCATTASHKDLILLLPYIKKSLCERLNIITNAKITTGNPPADNGGAWPTNAQYTGVFTSTGNAINDRPLTDITDNTTGCFEGDVRPASGTYHFYHVLLAR